MTDERIMARRVTLDEFCDYMGKLEYIEGRIVTGPGIELFVGVKEFPESIRRWKKREREYSKATANEKRAKGRKRDKRLARGREIDNVSFSAEGATDEELVLVAAGKMRLPKEPAVLQKLLKVRPRHSNHCDVTRALLDERKHSR